MSYLQMDSEMALPHTPVSSTKTDAVHLLRNSWIRWTIILVGWTVFSLFFAPEVYLYFLYKGERIPFREAAAFTAANTAIAALFVPGIVWLVHRFPFERQTWIRSTLVHVPACLLFSISHSFLYALMCYASPQLFHVLFLRFHPNILTYWGVVGVTEAVQYFKKYRQRERELAAAQLELLKAQLQPHFLFNTLHTISAMMHDDVKGADHMVNRLSDLLRLTLDSIGSHEVPLKQELAFLESYLEIERIRFQERLVLTVEASPEVLDALVPTMLLQPLAENSIRHGFGPERDSGTITIHAYRQESCLTIRVSDNGRGFPSEALPLLPEGVGLANVRRRLQQLYPGNYHLELENLRSGGAGLTLQIPYHTAAYEASDFLSELMLDEDSGTDRRRRALGSKADRYAPQA